MKISARRHVHEGVGMDGAKDRLCFQVSARAPTGVSHLTCGRVDPRASAGGERAAMALRSRTISVAFLFLKKKI